MNDIFEFSLDRMASIEEGNYEYSIVDVKLEQDVMTDYGIKQRFSFIFSLSINDEEEIFIKRLYYSKHTESKFMKFMQMFCDAYNTRKINLKSLIGTTGILTIEHTSDDKGNVYENISDIKPNIDEKTL